MSMLAVASPRRAVSGPTPSSGSTANNSNWQARPESPPQASSDAAGSGVVAGGGAGVAGCGFGPAHARRPGQTKVVSHPVEVIAHAHVGVVAGMHDAAGAAPPQRGQAGTRQVIGVDVVGVDVVVWLQHRAAFAHAFTRVTAFAVQRIDAGDAQDAGPRPGLQRLPAAPPPHARLGIHATAATVGGRCHRAGLVKQGTLGITINTGGAAIDERFHAATPCQRREQPRGARIGRAMARGRRQVQHPRGQASQACQASRLIQVAHQRHDARLP